MTLRFTRFSQYLAQESIIQRIWFGIVTTHDFDRHDDISKQRVYHNITLIQKMTFLHL